ncbi:MAG TPA: HEPN domain-containing protein [Azospirillum sp.]|nr:HEPN domain-containing protein [Azospirillum sp.]
MSANLAREWIAKADADLDAVERCLAGTLPNVIVACYHCQQAAEKLVKALLVAAEVRYPRGKEGHDIALCAAFLPVDHPLREEAMAFDDLTDWATAFRYPAEDPATAEPVPDARDVSGRCEALKGFRARVGAFLTMR